MNYKVSIIMFDFNDFDEKFSLKYSKGNVPKDYDISELFFTFDFINLVYKKENSIDEAVSAVSKKYRLNEQYLMDYFSNNNYILNKSNKNEISNQLKSYNTKSLKKLLKSHGLKASGKREKIEQRIIDNNLLGNNYYLSSKSRIFHKNKKRRVRIFNKYLSDFYYFDEFNEYYMDNFRKKENKIPTVYVDYHIEKAIEDKNHRNYVYNTYILSKIYHEYGNNKKMLENVLRIYCVTLNPVWRLDDLSNHGGFSYEIYNILQYLKGVLGKNRIISAYSAIWDSFNFESIIVPKYIGYRYLKQILAFKNYNKIIEELDEQFYSNENLKVKRIVQKTLFDF